MRLNSKAIKEIRKLMNESGLVTLDKIIDFATMNNLKTDSEGNLIK